MQEWGGSSEVKFDSEINASIMNDLDIPRVLIRLRAIEKDPSIGNQDKRAIFRYTDQILGLDLDKAPREILISEEAETLIAQRNQARAEANWSESDRLRDLLQSMGVEVQDKKS